MSVTFVIGRAGSGKTKRCFDAIVDALRDDPLGPPIYWLLPRQATFTAQRDLACSSGLGGFCRARIVSFDEFGRDVFENCGGESIPLIRPLGRQMILGHLLRKLEPQLQLFGGAARRAGLAAQLDQTFAELERGGKGADELAFMIRSVEQSAQRSVDAAFLLAKLRDIALVHQQYNAYLGQERLDQYRRATHVLASIERCHFLRNAQVYVDGFLEFDENDRRLLVALGKTAAKVEICLLIHPGSPTVHNPRQPPAEMNLFHRTEQAYRRLYLTMADAGVDMTPPVLLTEQSRFSAGTGLAALESSFEKPKASATESDGIEFLEASERRPETDAVARKIRWLWSQGYRLRDIAVLARDLDPYHAALAESFAEHAIPFFVDRRRSAAHHPLLRALRSILQIARFDWPSDAVLTLMKTGLAGATDDQCDSVENYLLGHFIRGNKGWCDREPWDDERPGGVDEEDIGPAATSVDQIRRQLVDKLTPSIKRLTAAEEQPIRTIASELFGAFDGLNVQKTLEHWMASASQSEQVEQAAEHQRVWGELVDLFEQMVELLGDESMSLERFSEVLESGLEQFDLALTPPTVDQVLVGQVDRTRSPRVRAVFVLGLSEGEFPATPMEKSILSDRERRELNRLSIDLDPDTRRRLMDEQLLGYIAMTRGSERLYLSRTAIDGGKRAVNPSIFWTRARQMFPTAPLHVARETLHGEVGQIATPRQLVTSLMRWTRDPAADAEANDIWRSLYQWLATRPVGEDAIDAVRYRSWKALSYANSAQLSPARRGALFPAPLTVSASQLESFARCPFSHFLRYGLRLRSRQRQQIGHLELGGLYSRLLAKLIDRAIRAKRSWDGPDAPIDSETIQSCLTEVDDLMAVHLQRSGGRGEYLLNRTRKTLVEFLAFQQELMRRSRFRPAFSAVSYGMGSQMTALNVVSAKGIRLAVKGRIDRVDLLQSGDDVCVMNYRLKAMPISMDQVYHGLSLQLLTSLLALQANGAALSGKPLNVAGAFTLQVPRMLKDVKHPCEAMAPDDPAFHLANKPRGFFSARQLSQLDRELETGKSAVLQVTIKKDGELGSSRFSDVANEAEFQSVLKHVERQIGELADRISSGDISVAPYRLGDKSPCVHCDYQSVCRFHVSTNQYRKLKVAGRGGVLEALGEDSDGG